MNLNYLSSKRILGILILILIVLNLILFELFEVNSPIFTYFGTKQFQTLTISLILPILLFLIDYVFKIREKIVEEKKNRQTQTIQSTKGLWNDLAKITTEFIYMEQLKEKEIGELQAKIDQFIIKAKDVLDSWNSEFTNVQEILKDQIPKSVSFTQIYLIPFNVLLSAILSASDLRHLAEFKDDIKRTRVIQEYILVIYYGIMGATYHPTVNILENAMLDLDAPDERIKKKIVDDFKELKEFSFDLIKSLFESYPEMPDTEFKDIVSYIEENKDKEYDLEVFTKDMNQKYQDLPDDKKLLLQEPYELPLDLIKNLAYNLKIREITEDFSNVNDLCIELKNTREDSSNKNDNCDT